MASRTDAQKKGSRTDAQKKGSLGEKLVLFKIEKHRDWLSRSLDEDFGIDCEAELTEYGVRGEILKIQVKSSQSVARRDGCIKVEVERKYVDYARTCRIPMLLVRVDLEEEEAWTLWLQDWILRKRSQGTDFTTAGPWTTWVPRSETLDAGLNGILKDIAQWRHRSQLVLGLLDGLRAAAAIADEQSLGALIGVVEGLHGGAPPWAMDVVIEEAAILGQRLRATKEGNAISQTLFELVRRFGEAASRKTVERIVLREEDTYSRTGLAALALLYDHHHGHVASMGLAARFVALGRPHVGYYCAWREAHPGRSGFAGDVERGLASFEYAGLVFDAPGDVFLNKYANRGPSAILDYLRPSTIT